jgi:glycerol dehydrogenase-like iron-containing ADH family enzyme
MNVWPLPRITFRELSSVKESRPTALITQPAWRNVQASLQLPLVVQAEPTKADRDYFDYLATHLPSAVEVIYALGDDLAFDAAKLVAQKSGRPLIIVPTMLSSDKALSPENVALADGAGPATEVVIDLEVIKAAPPYARAGAIVEVLSIVTGLMDWGYAAQKNQTTPETKFVPWAASLAAGLASQALKVASGLGKGESEALHMLVDLLCLTIQLDNQLGHRRASQGSEHIFADAVVTSATVVDVSYAERVAPGILLASALHKKDSAGLRTALESAGVRLTQLKPDDIRATVNALPDYVKQHQTPYTILNDVQPNSDDVTQALEKSTLFKEEHIS